MPAAMETHTLSLHELPSPLEICSVIVDPADSRDLVCKLGFDDIDFPAACFVSHGAKDFPESMDSHDSSKTGVSDEIEWSPGVDGTIWSQDRVFLFSPYPQDHDRISPMPKAKFGFFLDAFKYGAPPHGGLAFGIDRWLMVMLKEESIRDVIPFPKTNKGQCLMTETPNTIDEKQLEELFAVDRKSVV